MYIQFAKYDFERELRNVCLDLDLAIPEYVFDSAIRWLMENFHSLVEAPYADCAQALWNGFTNTESWDKCTALAHEFMEKYL